MALKAKFLVTVAPFEPTTDGHGATVDGWGEPVPHMVIGVAPGNGRSSETKRPNDVNRTTTTVDFEVYSHCPIGAPRSKWTLPNGTVAEQIGHPDDYRFGPFGQPSAGCASFLRRVEG